MGPRPVRGRRGAVPLVLAEPSRAHEADGLVALDGKLADGGAAGDLKAATLDSMGRGRAVATHAALRASIDADPARRHPIGRALAEHPTAADLPTLASALETRDATTGATALAAIRATSEGPGPLRDLIRPARRLGPGSRPALDDLAARWTGTEAPKSADFPSALAHWGRVYRDHYPDDAGLDEAAAPAKPSYTLDQPVAGVVRTGAIRSAWAARGKAVIARVRRLDCHKFADQGPGLGPDLSAISGRSRPEEIPESIVHPSKVVSDRYKSLTVATREGRVLRGMPVVTEGHKLVLLLPDGTRATVPVAEI